MKSIRLKRSNHNKSRKLRKGGNGSSSSSSQDNFTNLLNLLDNYQSYLGDINDLSREEPMDNIKIRQIQVDLNDLENSIVSIFRNNSLELSTLSVRQKEALLYAVLRTSGEIAEAYAHAYSNLETKEQMPIEIIDELINEFEIDIENIEIDIENGDDYDDDEYDYYVNAFTYLNIIKQIIEEDQPLRIQRMKQKVVDTARTISTIQPMGSNAKFVLPPNVKKTIGELIHDPRYYKHVSAKPNSHPILGADWKANSSSSSSSSALGGRRVKSNRSRKTRRRK
jgi:hypothetical protein